MCNAWTGLYRKLFIQKKNNYTKMLALKVWRNFDFWLKIMILIDVHIPKNNGNVTKEWERLEFECNDWKRREIKNDDGCYCNHNIFFFKTSKNVRNIVCSKNTNGRIWKFFIKNSIIH